MNLVFNEKELLRKSLEEGYIDYDKTSNTIRILAKYCFSNDMSKRQVYDFINNFFTKNYKKYNSVKWQNTFDRIINKVYRDKNFKLLNIDKIIISQSELDIINGLEDIKYEKLAFSLLVYAKIYNQMNKSDTGWVNAEQKYIFSDAKLKESTYNQGIMLHYLGEIGLINASKMVNCTNIKVDFIDESSSIVLEISDFRNFVYVYLRWCGENIINCNRCGILIYPLSNHHKYCKSCWNDIRDQQNRDKSLKYYHKTKNFTT